MLTKAEYEELMEYQLLLITRDGIDIWIDITDDYEVESNEDSPPIKKAGVVDEDSPPIKKVGVVDE